MSLSAISLMLFSAMVALAADQTPCRDNLCSSLQARGLHPRAYELMVEKVKELKYAKDAVAIADYTLPSDQERFFVINLKAQTFNVFHVSHGAGSGNSYAVLFSNISGQRQSALGFMRTAPHSGKFGKGFVMTGISKFNTRVVPANGILLHCAEYSSQEFFNAHGFWGRSYGCLTLPCENIEEVVAELGSNALVLSYHDVLWDTAQTNTKIQELPDHAPITPATNWEVDENLHGRPAGPYKTKYKNEIIKNE